MEKPIDFRKTRDVEIRRFEEVRQTVQEDMKVGLLAVGEKIVSGVAFAEPGLGEEWHAHAEDFEEVVYIVRGKMEVEWEVKGKQIKKANGSAGDMVFFPPGVQNRFINTGTEPLMIVFAGPRVRKPRKE